jgi:hypothetical protein
MRRPITYLVAVFILSLIYLHQKIALHIEAYRLSNHYKIYNDLVDKRDALLYNFYKSTSLEKVNLWAESNRFQPPQKERVFAFRMTPETGAQEKDFTISGIIAYLNRRLFVLSTKASEALAKEKKE